MEPVARARDRAGRTRAGSALPSDQEVDRLGIDGGVGGDGGVGVVADAAMSTTVRDMIRAVQVELRDGEVAPSRARELLIELTALSGNCSTELRQAEADYNAVLLKHLDSDEAAN